MPLSTTIREIYIRLAEYPNIRDTASLKDAFAVLQSAYSTGKLYRHILVLDGRDQLVGLLGIHDLLHGLFPDYLRAGEHQRFEGAQPDFPALTLIWQETCATQCKEAARNPVKGFMGAVPPAVKLGDPVGSLLLKSTSSVMRGAGDPLERNVGRNIKKRFSPPRSLKY